MNRARGCQRGGLKEAAELELEEGFFLPVGEGVAVDGERCGDGIGGMPGDEKTNGAELGRGEGSVGAASQNLGVRSWVRFAYGSLRGRFGVVWRALAKAGGCGARCWN